eukprot:4199638-Prorocentrum_lima.AAC.1
MPLHWDLRRNGKVQGVMLPPRLTQAQPLPLGPRVSGWLSIWLISNGSGQNHRTHPGSITNWTGTFRPHL